MSKLQPPHKSHPFDEPASIVLGLLTIIVSVPVIAEALSLNLSAGVYLVWIFTLAAAINLGIVFESSDANFAHVIITAAFLALGLGPAMIITLLGVLLGESTRAVWHRQLRIKRRRPRRMLAITSGNLSRYGLSLLGGGKLYVAVGGPLPIAIPSGVNWALADWASTVWPLVGLFAGYLTINNALFALYLRLESREAVRQYFTQHWRAIVALEIIPIGFAAIIAGTSVNVPPVAFGIFCVFLIGIMLITHGLSDARNRLEKRVRELASLNAIGQAVANSLNLPEVLESIHHQTAKLMEARHFCVALYNHHSQELTFPLAYEFGQLVHYRSRPFAAGLTEYVIEARQPLLLKSDVQAVLRQLGREAIEPMPQSWLGVPITAADQVLGVIVVQDPEQPDRYSEDDRDVLVTIASQAAAAIQNAQMFTTVRHHATELAILNSVSSAVGSTLDLNEVLDLIVTSVSQVAGNQKAAIFLTGDSGQSVRLAASHGLSPQYAAHLRSTPFDYGERSSVIHTRQPLIVADIHTDPRMTDFRAIAEAEGLHSFADVPLQIHAQVVGTLTVYYSEPHHFTSTEIDLLNTFANQVAVAVANAKLHAQTDQALARRDEQMAALEKIGQELSASLEFDQTIQRVLERAMAATHADFGSVGLLSSDQEYIKPTAMRGYSPEIAQHLSQEDWPVTKGVVGRAIRLGQPVYIDNVQTDPDYFSIEPSVRSKMVIPIQSDARTLGVINLESVESGCFDDQSLDFARQLATQAAIALQNTQILSQAQSRLREMSVLYALGQQLTSILDLRQLGQELTKQMAHALNTTHCSLELLHANSGQMETIAYYYSPDPELSTSASSVDPVYRLADYPATQAAIDQRQPLIVYASDHKADLAEVAGMRRPGLCSTLTIPLVSGNEVLGTVEWADERLQRRFRDDELRLAATLANQAAIAVQNAWLFEDRARRISELSQLYQASLALTASVELDEVLHRISLVAHEITGADVVTLYLYDSTTDTFYNASSLGQDGIWTAAIMIRRTGLTRRVIHQGSPILISDTVLEPDINPVVVEAGIRSLICVPLIAKAQPLGVLYVNSFSPNKFDGDNVQMVSALANQAAVAIENARLFADIAEGRDKLRAILNSTHDGILMFDTTTRIVMVNPQLEEMWDLSRAGLENRTLIELLERSEFQIADKMGYSAETLRTQLAQVRNGQVIAWPKETYALPSGTRQRFVERSGLPVLDASNRLIGWMMVLRDVTEERELQQMRDNLAHMIVHDLRSPLSSILGSLHILDEVIPPDNQTSVERQALSISTRSTRKLLDLVNSLLDISKLTSGQALIVSTPASLGAVIDAAMERLSPLAIEEGVIVRKQIQPDLPPVLIDEEKISRVLINLLDNALKFTPQGGQVTILAERQAAPPSDNDPTRPTLVCCTVRDTGPGIPPEYRERIFDRFAQITYQPGRRHGTGLGLSFCKLAVEAHGGKIWVGDAPGGGSEFVFTLPIAKLDR